jgi:hypothetical protein
LGVQGLFYAKFLLTNYELFNILKPERHVNKILCEHSVPISQKKHIICIKNKCFMSFKKIIIVYFKNHTKYVQSVK